MSGHNKWSKVKGKKEVTDKEKGKLYTLFARRISIALREGKGVDQAVEAAKNASVPRHVIDRALKKNAEGKELKEMEFEGFLLGGKIGIIIIALTESSTRTSNQIRSTLERHGGKFGEPGALAYLFTKKGIFYIERSDANINLCLESGADDYFEEDDEVRVETSAENLKNVADFFKNKRVEFWGEEIIYSPIANVELSEHEKDQLDAVLSSLSLMDDVSEVYTNASP